MSTENTPVEHVSDDLDEFSADFFGQSKPETEDPTPASDEVVETADVEDALEENDTHEDDALEDNDEPEVEAKPEPKKSRTQERIDELTGKYREEQRERLALAAKLEETIAKLNQDKPTPAVKASTTPDPTDQNEDGTDKYPLGEFDAQYIRDLTRHTLNEEREAMKAKDAAENEARELDIQQNALSESWTEKLGPAQERYPDYNDKGQELISAFASLDPAYGNYLSATLMSLENGHDVLYYLANNLDEADNIVKSGPTKATIALGRLDAKFAPEDKPVVKPRVSNAPTPPPQNKGSAMAVAEVPDDTDDLDTFSAKFFKSKRGSK